ncbi:PEGA domain-containing protein [bacterium]|nr:PEGA domain-containing protein [bacterium]
MTTEFLKLRRIRAIWLLLGLSALAGGCVERRYTVRTNPPGALVYANGEEIGKTPVSRSFTYYGDREFTLVQDGFETQRVVTPIKAPWYDNLFTEFFSENLIPWTIRDERELVFDMQPVQNEQTGDLLGRAEALRAEGQAGPEAVPEGRRGLFGWFRR